MVLYTIKPDFPEAHLFQVELQVSQPDPKGQLVTLPAWIPGSYMIRDFARNIVQISATSDGHENLLEKVDKQSWRCQPCEGMLSIRYQVYAWDLSVRGAYLDTTRGFFNGTSVFLKVAGQEYSPCEVCIEPPSGAAYKKWRVATTLARSGAEYQSFGLYHAENYDELIDHPVEMGFFAQESFPVAGVAHEIVISGRHTADISRIKCDLQLICEQHVELFGELPDMERYLFMVFATGEGYGGLEHRASTSLVCSRSDLPLVTNKEMTDGYRRFLGLCSHEYFHLWNVKRIRPEILKNADLSKEAHTTLLWAFEGITSYFDDLALVRSGRITTESYLELLARQITRERRGAGRNKQTLSESSFDAWTKFYKQDENAPNSIVSYYNKGALVALALDLTIREYTRGDRSLDDVMRYLWQRYGKPDVGLQERDVERAASEVSGKPLYDFFDRFVRNTDELPLARLLKGVGVGMDIRPARAPDDQGGLRREPIRADKPVPVLGASYKLEGQDIRLTHVYDHGAAQVAGLSAGDVVIAVSGIRATGADLNRMIAEVSEGNVVSLHVFRRDELMEFKVKPLPAPADTCELWLLDEIDSDVAANRSRWLKLVAPH